MKFGTEYQEALRREEYPQQWIESAISYRKLKKCIKTVQRELLSLGLDRDTLETLWQQVGLTNSSATKRDDSERLMQYQFSTEPGVKFVPKLTIALDPRDGSPMNAWLSPETRETLRKVGQRRESTTASLSSVKSNEEKPTRLIREGLVDVSSNGIESDADHDDELVIEPVETIEVPLTSDSEFFQILRKELNSLEDLQAKEQSTIAQEITTLGNDLQALKASNKKHSKVELNYWREIFRLYIENQIFMSNSEYDAGIRPADKAAAHLQQFSKEIARLPNNPKKTGKSVSKENHIALERFLQINTTMLRLLKFQELNRTALTKIMKKFDKRTALHAQTSLLTPLIRRPAMTRDLVRATIYTISNNLLQVIPQLDDYLCPVCSELTYKPIRLRCSHVFCIRCLIRLQRDNKDECPLCREHVVLEATEEHLDKQLKRFLKQNFPEEARAKQKDNEFQAGVDIFGENYKGTHKCAVM